MSGDKKKRSSKAQGWEEAQDEFYQERYQADGDLDAFEKDPKKITTLLPSKQTRGTLATRRIHKNGKDKGTVRRRTSTRSAHDTNRRQSVNQENFVATLPDLSENLSTEETTWEEIMAIKDRPITLAEKRQLKAELQKGTKLRLQGYEQFKWRRRKFMQELSTQWNEMYAKFEIWKTSLKTIEGTYGTGVVTYFQFIKWLIFLNVSLFLFLFIFVILPALTLEANESDSQIVIDTDVVSCIANHSDPANSTTLTDILDFVQGTGWMENTYLFYGVYESSILLLPGGGSHYYNLPFAYILVTIGIFILSLCCIVKSAARGFRERLLEGEGQYYHFCNLVFGGWDFCIGNEHAAELKHKALHNEIRSHLLEERLKDEISQRSNDDATKLMFVRLFIHTIVIALLVGSGALIYFAFSFSKSELEKSEEDLNSVERLLLEYLPSITIVALNSIVPIILQNLVKWEKYTPRNVVRMTMLRTVFLRLASLLVLIVTLRTLVACDCSNGCQQLRCWETYVGQTFYKLVLLDFATHLILTFFVNFPRMLLAKHIRLRFFKFIGQQEFNLPKHVLDVVYSQTLCWLGLYFAPFLPALVAVKLIIMFYIKKFVCLVNCDPSSTVHLASRSKSMYMLILLVGYIVAVIPVALSIGEVSPSLLCGPFRGKTVVWDVVLTAFNTLPYDLKSIIFYIGTAGFAVPAFIILGMALYYYYAISEANKHRVTVLKNQLILEGHDKQFLLTRLTAMLKQQEQSRMVARSIVTNPDISSITDNSNAS